MTAPPLQDRSIRPHTLDAGIDVEDVNGAVESDVHSNRTAKLYISAPKLIPLARILTVRVKEFDEGTAPILWNRTDVIPFVDQSKDASVSSHGYVDH
jgi:hypothetical protein